MHSALRNAVTKLRFIFGLQGISGCFFLVDAENCTDVRVGLTAHFFERGVVEISEERSNDGYESRFIALASVRNGRHVGCISLENDTGKWNYGGEGLRQLGVLEREYTTDTKHEVWELEQLLSHFGRACETVKYTSKMVEIMPLDARQKFVVCLASMYHQWKIEFLRPFYLLFEGLNLFCAVAVVPIEIKANFTDGYGTWIWCSEKEVLHAAKREIDIHLVGKYLFGMKPYHRVEEIWILLANLKEMWKTFNIDGRHKDFFNACIPGTQNHVGEIFSKLRAIDVGMGIYHSVGSV